MRIGVLLALSAFALLSICDVHVNVIIDYSISLNASKSKYLVILPSIRRLLYNYIKNYNVGGSPI